MPEGALPSNRYRKSDKAITYNVLRTDFGWRIEALTPKKITVDDRAKVIEWFRTYRSAVRAQHPLWITRFYSTESGYFLEIKPMKNPRELAEKGQDLRAIWTDEVANRA